MSELLSFYSWKQDKRRCSRGAGRRVAVQLPAMALILFYHGPLRFTADFAEWQSKPSDYLPVFWFGVFFFLLRYRLPQLDDLEQPCFRWWWCGILPSHQLLQKRIKIFEGRECKGRGFPNVSAVIAVDWFSGHIFLYFPPWGSRTCCSVLPRLSCGLVVFLDCLITVTDYTYTEELLGTFLHFCQFTPQSGNGLKYLNL